jgi:hypothetical protein
VIEKKKGNKRGKGEERKRSREQGGRENQQAGYQAERIIRRQIDLGAGGISRVACIYVRSQSRPTHAGGAVGEKSRERRDRERLEERRSTGSCWRWRCNGFK